MNYLAPPVTLVLRNCVDENQQQYTEHAVMTSACTAKQVTGYQAMHWPALAANLPVSACAEAQEASLLLKSESHYNFPKLLDGLMLSCVASIIACVGFQLSKVQMWQPTN